MTNKVSLAKPVQAARRKRAIITGVSGQDGAYLARLLIDKGYDVVGTTRRPGGADRWRLGAVGADAMPVRPLVLDDPDAVRALVAEIQPDEFYHLGSQSSVGRSFDEPVETARTNAMPALHVLDALRRASPRTRCFLASSSEIYGQPKTLPQTEDGPFEPVSPYGIASLFAHLQAGSYRALYDVFAVSGILFNHESPLRDQRFVSQKIVDSLVCAILENGPPLQIGNLDARRDWGYAAEYVEAMWLSLQHDEACDYVIASGETHSVRDFVEKSAATLGATLQWKGEGVEETAVCALSGRTLVQVDPKFFRKADSPLTLGSYARAEAKLGWRPRTRFAGLVAMMTEAARARRASAPALAERAR